jgi:hypothetical protein
MFGRAEGFRCRYRSACANVRLGFEPGWRGRSFPLAPELIVCGKGEGRRAARDGRREVCRFVAMRAEVTEIVGVARFPKKIEQMNVLACESVREPERMFDQLRRVQAAIEVGR